MDDFILTVNKWIANNGWSDVVDAEWAVKCAGEIAFLAKTDTRLSEQTHRLCSKHLSVRLHNQCAAGDAVVKNTAYTALYGFMARMAMPRLRDEVLAQEAAQRALEIIYRSVKTVRDPQAFLGFCQVVMMRVIFSESHRKGSAAQDMAHLEEMLETESGKANQSDHSPDSISNEGCLQEADRQAVRSTFWKKICNTPALSALDKKLLVWVYQEDVSRQEICRREKLSRSALDVKLHRARKKITQNPQLYAILVDLAQVL